MGAPDPLQHLLMAREQLDALIEMLTGAMGPAAAPVPPPPAPVVGGDAVGF